MARRLAAVLSVDVVGYSRLMGADEAGTLAAINEHRKELFEPKALQYHGRTVKLMGDGALMEFPSAVDAVSFAVEVQCAMRERNRDVPKKRQILCRIGINIGDIIIEDDDIFGDGVNIAARLERLAEPGGICVARNVLNQVKGKLDLTVKALGRRKVKNISQPVTVYRLVLDDKAAQLITEIPEAASTRAGWQPYAAVILVLLLVGAGIVWWQPWAPSMKFTPVEKTSVEKTSLPLPDKPSIAVLPFTNMSDDKEQDYFADGMTEDLTTDLSKVSGLFVIARNSTFTYKGRSVQVQQIARELGVRYLLEGSVRRVGDNVRINAQLIDATSGGHLWAERYDGTMADVFALQSQVTGKIVSALSVRLGSGELTAVVRRETESSAAYDVFLKGWGHYLRQRPDEFRRAIDRFEQAIKLDPNYSRAHAALAATYWQIWRRSWHDLFGFTDPHSPRIRAESSLQQAMRNPNPLAFQLSAAMLSQRGRHVDAIDAAERAIALDANNADSYVAFADALSLAGRGTDALRRIERAIRLNPFYPPFYLYELGLAQFVTNKLPEAAETLERAISLNPEDNWSARLLISINGLLGRTEKIAGIRDLAEENWRGFDPLSIRGIAFWYPFKRTADAERLAAGLRKAGVPD